MIPIEINEIPVEIKNWLSTITSISFPRQGYTSDVVFIEANFQKFVLKRAKGEKYCSLLKKEAKILEVLSNQTKIATPRIFKFVEDSKESWLLMECFEGVTVRAALLNETSKSKREEIIFNYGKVLSEIHQLPCPTELKKKTHWLDDMLLQAKFNLENSTVDGDEILLNKLMSNPLIIDNQTFIHGDFTIDNVLVHDGKVTGIIDWGTASFGDPRYDLSLAIRPKPYAFQNDTDKQIFFEGYGQHIVDKHIFDFYVGLYEFD